MEELPEADSAEDAQLVVCELQSALDSFPSSFVLVKLNSLLERFSR